MRRDVRNPSAAIDVLLVFGAALAFYSATLAPTVLWGDSAGLARHVVFGPLQIGTASNHPLFVLIGRLLSVLPVELGHVLNFESALFGALAVAMVYRCARQVGASRLPALIGASSLCVSHAFWLHSVIAEVYSANAFFLAATLSLLLDWKRRRRARDLVAAIGVLSIGLTNHLVLAAVVPAAAVFVVATEPGTFLNRRMLVCVAAGIATLVVVALLIPSAASAFRTLWLGPPSIWEFFRLDVEPVPIVREAGYYLLFLTYQFPSIALPLGFVGIWAILRRDRRAAALLLLTIAVNGGIFVHHTWWSSAGGTKFVFYIADYVVFSILCAVGAEQVLEWIASRRGADQSRRWGLGVLAAASLFPPIVYAAVPAAANRAGVDLVHARFLPYRDNQRYFLNPNKHGEDGARRYATEALHIVKPGAVIFADSTPYEVLRYLQYRENVRPDVLVRSPHYYGDPVIVEWIDADGHRRPAYLAALTRDYDLRGLTGGYDLIPTGPIIEIRPREAR